MNEFSPYEHSARKSLEQCNALMLGVLADPELVPPNVFSQEPITLNRNENGILVFFQPVSPEPEDIEMLNGYLQQNNLHNLYIALPRAHLGKHLPAGYHLQNDTKRIDMLKTRFQNKLVLFAPKIEYQDNKIYKNLSVISIEDYKQGMTYETVPNITSCNPEQFEEKLKLGVPVAMDDYSYTSFGPEYVICDESIYWIKTGWRATQEGYIVNNPGLVKVTKLDQDWDQHQIFGKETLFFFEKPYLDQMETKTWLHLNAKDHVSEEVLKVNNPPAIAPKALDKSLGNDEYRFIRYLESLAKADGLCYSQETLVNFHVSVKTNSVTILSGMSGTGKSQLALLYAKALGLLDEEAEYRRLLMLPISPSYTEPEDLLGYLNAATGIYVPTDTGFVDFLIGASKHPDKMHMVVFDEMNLSQVEHWFSPFISILELPVGERILNLYAPNQVCHNNSKYPSEVKIGENILFVGTANMDETTRTFSDRLLDRVNVVVPEKMDFLDLRKMKDRNDDEDYGSEIPDNFGNSDNFRKWMYTGDVWKAFPESILEFFDDLHRLINRVDPQKGVSFRTLRKIGEYLNSIPKDPFGTPMIKEEDVFDLQVKQRILTKIRGSSEQFRDLIGEAADSTATSVNSPLYQHFISQEATLVSHFTATTAEILRKARELHMYDYAS